MTIDQLIAQWNASIETVQRSPSPAPLEDSPVQVRTGISAGAWVYHPNPNRGSEVYNTSTGEETTCTWSTSPTPGCYN
jgi:hypothetical protein